MNLCVYCGATDNVDQKFKDLAYDVGIYMAKNNLDLVYGGGCFGLMGSVAQGVVDKWRPCNWLYSSISY